MKTSDLAYEEIVAKYECGGNCTATNGGNANSAYELYLVNGAGRGYLHDTSGGASQLQGNRLI